MSLLSVINITLVLSPVAAQSPPAFPDTLQSYVAKMDTAMDRPDGEWRGRLTHRTGSDTREVRRVRLYKKGSDALYEIHRFKGGLEARILFKKRGEEVWFYDALRNRLHNISDNASLRPLLDTSLFFGDLSGLSFETSCDVADGKPVVTEKGESFLHVWLKPLMPRETPASFPPTGNRKRFSGLIPGRNDPPPPPPESKRRIVAVLDPDRSFAPLRMDFYDEEGILFRVLHFFYATSGRAGMAAQSLDGAGGELREETLFRRLEALDLRTGVITRFEFFEYHKNAPLPAELFDPRFLER